MDTGNRVVKTWGVGRGLEEEGKVERRMGDSCNIINNKK